MSDENRCAHDPTPYLPQMWQAGVRIANTNCPFESTARSRYCFPHTILHNENISPALEAEIQTYVAKAVSHFREGFIVVRADGALIRPVWWQARTN